MGMPDDGFRPGSAVVLQGGGRGYGISGKGRIPAELHQIYRVAGGGIRCAAGEVVNRRKVAAQRIKRAPPPKSCQVLFAGGSEKDLSKILPGLGPGVLSVGEGETFLRDGGMIAFVVENRRVRFEINRTAADNAGIKLSSRLLSVAKSVE
jgi:hypothetical protein